MDDLLTDIRNEASIRKEGFIEIDASKLKAELIEQGHGLITHIFNVLAKQSREDLNSFLYEIKSSIDELKRNTETTEQLSKNMKLLKDVKAKKD